MTDAAEPRIPPLPPDEWPPEMRDALAALIPPDARHPRPKQGEGRPKGLNVLGTMAQHPTLAKAFHTFNGHILFTSMLAPRERELIVLRVAAVRDCEYEWRQHVVQARDAGLTDDEIDRVRREPDSDQWLVTDAALLAAVDELIADARISDRTWAVVAGELDDQQLMDVIFTVGAYDALAMAMRSFGMELDADLQDQRGPP
jgi:AhpD family alkylhydroperoxidase